MFNGLLASVVAGAITYALVAFLTANTSISFPFTATAAAAVVGVLVFLAAVFG